MHGPLGGLVKLLLHTYIHIWVCIYIRKHKTMCIYICTQILIWRVYIYICIHVYVFTMYIYKYTYKYLYTHVYIHICISEYIYIIHI